MADQSVPTSMTLLERLRKPGEEEAWARFVRLYTPLLLEWARRVGCTGEQADDLLQEVFLVLFQKLPTFEYRPTDGSFRGWLREVTRHKLWELRRGKWQTVAGSSEDLDAVVAPSDSDPFEEQEFRQYVIQRTLALMQTDFTEGTWRAFQEHAIKGRPAEEIARELKISVDAVYSVKSRVLKRLREEIAGQIE